MEASQTGHRSNLMNGIDDTITPALDAAKDQLADFNERALAFARERPVACLVGAVAVGFIFGKLASKL